MEKSEIVRDRLGVALVTTALSGCAFVDVQLEPVTALESLPNVGGGREVLVSPFIDSRPAPRCGMKKNGFNLETADVICPESNMGFAVGRVFRDYLHAAGFAVVTLEQRRSADPLFIYGRVDQLFVEPVISFFTATVETDIGVHVLAQTQSGMTADRYFYVKGEDSNFWGLDAGFQTSYERAVHELFSSMTRAVADLMNRHPDIGVRARHRPTGCFRVPSFWPAAEAVPPAPAALAFGEPFEPMERFLPGGT